MDGLLVGVLGAAHVERPLRDLAPPGLEERQQRLAPPRVEVAQHVVCRALRRALGVLDGAFEHAALHLAALDAPQHLTNPEQVMAAGGRAGDLLQQAHGHGEILHQGRDLLDHLLPGLALLPPQLQLEGAPHRVGADALGVGHHPQQERRVALLGDASHEAIGAARPQATAGQGQDLGPALGAGLALGEHAGQLALAGFGHTRRDGAHVALQGRRRQKLAEGAVGEAVGGRVLHPACVGDEQARALGDLSDEGGGAPAVFAQPLNVVGVRLQGGDQGVAPVRLTLQAVQAQGGPAEELKGEVGLPHQRDGGGVLGVVVTGEQELERPLVEVAATARHVLPGAQQEANEGEQERVLGEAAQAWGAAEAL